MLLGFMIGPFLMLLQPVFSQGYQGVANTSQGKMEMLESVDQYLKSGLQTELKALRQDILELKEQVEKMQPEMEAIKTSVEELKQSAVLKEAPEWTDTLKKVEGNEAEIVKIRTLVEDWDKGRVGTMEKDILLMKSSLKSLEGVLNSVDAYKNITLTMGSGPATFALPGSGSGSGTGSGSGSGTGTGSGSGSGSGDGEGQTP
jgi:hypothetical protein